MEGFLEKVTFGDSGISHCGKDRGIVTCSDVGGGKREEIEQPWHE